MLGVFTEQPLNAIGFTAYANVERFYQPAQQVLFDSVINNEGLGYQQTTSIFICPVDGLYMFATTLCSNSTEFSADILKENERMATVKSHNGHEDQGMVNVVVECAGSERVWVKVNTEEGKVILSEESRYTTFSGFLINY